MIYFNDSVCNIDALMEQSVDSLQVQIFQCPGSGIGHTNVTLSEKGLCSGRNCPEQLCDVALTFCSVSETLPGTSGSRRGQKIQTVCALAKLRNDGESLEEKARSYERQTAPTKDRPLSGSNTKWPFSL